MPPVRDGMLAKRNKLAHKMKRTEKRLQALPGPDQQTHGSAMMGDAVSTYQWRLWQRRAATLARNAHALSCDMIDRLGLDNPATDASDGMFAAVEDFENYCARQAENAKRRSSTPS